MYQKNLITINIFPVYITIFKLEAFRVYRGEIQVSTVQASHYLQNCKIVNNNIAIIGVNKS